MKRFGIVFCLLVLAVSQPSAAEEAKSGRFLHEVVAASQAHRESLQQLLRKTQRLPPWVRNMITNPLYVSGASTAVTIAEKPFELFGACLVKLCPQSHLRILFTPQGKIASMRIVDEKMGEIVLGEPDADQLLQLSKPGI
ncbi:inhibitor of vertebrate lysozyme family protein [Rhizobium lemnae]|uniref:Ivy family c-type lysozyme inhibitor n=1 Tax=Rhizobium lemnae TaxID=1214924 RepID=A0ABV8E628_9HYPH|nr:Ivy family c-type lysozyme inhibitor [Rhizobium lemnae]MCJ8508213.1 inhibitor of vertebrate lysozyme family protein [Rhizobium lemnae]